MLYESNDWVVKKFPIDKCHKNKNAKWMYNKTMNDRLKNNNVWKTLDDDGVIFIEDRVVLKNRFKVILVYTITNLIGK